MMRIEYRWKSKFSQPPTNAVFPPIILISIYFATNLSAFADQSKLDELIISEAIREQVPVYSPKTQISVTVKACIVRINMKHKRICGTKFDDSIAISSTEVIDLTEFKAPEILSNHSMIVFPIRSDIDVGVPTNSGVTIRKCSGQDGFRPKNILKIDVRKKYKFELYSILLRYWKNNCIK